MREHNSISLKAMKEGGRSLLIVTLKLIGLMLTARIRRFLPWTMVHSVRQWYGIVIQGVFSGSVTQLYGSANKLGVVKSAIVA